MEDRLFGLYVDKEYSHRDVFSGQVDLAYDIQINLVLFMVNYSIIKAHSFLLLSMELQTLF